VIVIHGNQTERVPAPYRRYLVNAFREALKLTGTPIRIEFRTGENPYQGRRNKLTGRQQKRRSRLLRHVKKR
jgi:GTP-binding protein